MTLEHVLNQRQNLRARAQRIAQSSRELSAQIDLLQGGGGEDAAENGSERAAAAPKSHAVRAVARLSTRHRATKQRLMALQQEQAQAQRRLLAESGWAEGGAGRQHGGDAERRKLEAEYMEAIAAAENSDEDVAAAAEAAEREAGHSESHARCGIDSGRGGDGGGDGDKGPVATLALSVAIGLLALACGYALWGSLIAHVGDVARSHWLPLPAARLELPLVLRWGLPTPEDWGKFSLAGLWRAAARRLVDDGSAGDVGADNEEL